MNNDSEVGAMNHLYLLSFIDVMDRLDILMLEIRHLQQTIIYSLKAPSLYLPLRHEECYLFGDNWDDEISGPPGLGSLDIKLAKKWVIRYPTPKSAIEYYCKNPEVSDDGDENRIEKTIKHRIGKIWMGDNWVRNQRRQYHSLYALQILKQHVLCDKISLARAALKANLLDRKDHHSVLQKPAFLIIRSGVLEKVDEYVLILRNHKHQVGQSIEFGMPNDPHPSTERRRDMGIFMDFIFNRTVDIQRDILHLYKVFNQSDKSKTEDSLLMFHGWSQNTAVSTLQLDDVINSTYNSFSLENEKIEEHPIGYVSTSFWTPDRPDLHPMIAYSVAESVIRNMLNRLDDVALSNNNDDFTGLIARLKFVLVEFVSTTPAMGYLKQDIDRLLKEIAADLLAASVKGIAYLYSLFLAITGKGLASQLYVGKKIKLEMVYALEQGTAMYNDAIFWYLRLNITAAWLSSAIKGKSDLDKKIIQGVKSLTNELLNFLNEYTPLNRDRITPYWAELLQRLINEMEVSAPILLVCKWREKRAKDGEQGKRADNDLNKESTRRFARSTRRLNIRLQNYLFRRLVHHKMAKGQPLYKSGTKLKERFEEVYSLSIDKIDIPDEKGHSVSHPRTLFSHIHDIPYQSAVLRSIDILEHGGLTYSQLFEQLHWNMELGRGLFSLALEFYTRESESPKQRLSLCINQIAYVYHEIKGESGLEALSHKLEVWLIGKKDKPDLSTGIDEELKKELAKDASSIGANQLAEASAKLRIEQAEEIRQLENIAGYKLRELLEILKDKKIYHHHKKETYFYSLIQFLSLRRSKSEVGRKPKELFYNHMLSALGDVSRKKKHDYEADRYKHFSEEYLPAGFSSFMLHRLSVTNYYPISDPAHLGSAKDNQNGLYLAENLKRRHWETNFEKGQSSHTWVTLGRFDAVSLIKVKLPCKCFVQGFSDGLSLPNNNISETADEKFSPYFSRREIARPIKIIPEIGDTLEYQMFSMISVTLQRRSMRLDFLYRMIRALEEGYLSGYHSNLETGILSLREKNIVVKGFLTDGWGDIVFKFSKKNVSGGKLNLSESDIESIFSFQRAVYEDFMVDRTEIIFAPQCIDHTLGYSDKYRITMEVRMMEDRWLEPGVGVYKKALLEITNKPLDFLKKVEITMIPGRNDFNFKFIVDEEYLDKNESTSSGKYIPHAYLRIVEWLNTNNAMSMLGHVETYIGRVGDNP